MTEFIQVAKQVYHKFIDDIVDRDKACYLINYGYMVNDEMVAKKVGSEFFIDSGYTRKSTPGRLKFKGGKK